MIRRTTCHAAIAALACVAVAIVNETAQATSISNNVPVSGNFGASLSGNGNVQLTSASGQYWEGLGFTHATFGVTAGVQTPSITVTPVTRNMPSSGTTNLTYDNVTPGTGQSVNSLSADLNGADGSNTNIPLTISVGNINVTISGLVTVPLALTVSGNITDLTFASTGASAIDGLGDYSVPGNYTATIVANVNGMITGLPLISSINLGTLTTINTSVTFPGSLPGSLLLQDLQGGLPPFPNDMLATLATALPFSVPIPLVTPINYTQPTQSFNNTHSGFTTLTLAGQLNATLTLGNPSYSLSGQVAQTLVPEPSSMILLGFGVAGLGAIAWRARKRTIDAN